MQDYRVKVEQEKCTWLVTGAAGFIGSNLVEELLRLDQKVIGIDNFSNGFRENIEDIKRQVPDKIENFDFIEGDICHYDICLYGCSKADYILHNAALNSVPRSIDNPRNTNRSNVTGTLNMLTAATQYKNIRRFVYAASSSTYGDHKALPKTEEVIGSPLSPYAVSKYVIELYANVFHKVYNLDVLGLRYFNVFGKRQNPFLTYAAVIPKWCGLVLNGKQPTIFGDGLTTRDFCYIKNVIQANLLAAKAPKFDLKNRVMNIAYGQQTTLNDLLEMIKKHLDGEHLETIYAPFRQADVQHSLADTNRAREIIGYDPQYTVNMGIKEYTDWYKESHDWVPSEQPKVRV